jgi:hypothetical protein
MPGKKKKTKGSWETSRKTAGGVTAKERAAMKERARERKAPDKAEGEGAVLAKIAEMPEPDRTMATRLHAIIRAHAPDLSPRLWYGMPAYARGGKVICFFQGAYKFQTRYATLGFTDAARLDEGAMWPVAFALRGMSEAEEACIIALIRKAVGL